MIMKGVEMFFILMFTAVVAFIVFVSAGKSGGATGGTQTAQIAAGLGEAITNIGAGLETGTRY